MGVRVLFDGKRDLAALYCSTADWAFGPVFYDDKQGNAGDRADRFLEWLGGHGLDARSVSDSDLAKLYATWDREDEAKIECPNHAGHWLAPGAACADCQEDAELDADERAEAERRAGR